MQRKIPSQQDSSTSTWVSIGDSAIPVPRFVFTNIRNKFDKHVQNWQSKNNDRLAFLALQEAFKIVFTVFRKYRGIPRKMLSKNTERTSRWANISREKCLMIISVYNTRHRPRRSVLKSRSLRLPSQGHNYMHVLEVTTNVQCP